MTKEKINEYTLRISQANRSTLIVILYEMALDYIEAGRNAIDSGDHEELRRECGYAGKVISDLIGALDHNYELSVSLRQVYTYIQSRISLGVIKNSREELDKVMEMLKKLKGSFEQVAKSDTSKSLMRNTESIYTGLTYGKKAIYDSLTTEVGRGFKV